MDQGLRDPDHEMATRRPFHRPPSFADHLGSAALLILAGTGLLWIGWMLLGLVADWIER